MNYVISTINELILSILVNLFISCGKLRFNTYTTKHIHTDKLTTLLEAYVKT